MIAPISNNNDIRHLDQATDAQANSSVAATATQNATTSGVANHQPNVVPPAAPVNAQNVATLAPTSGVPSHQVAASVPRLAAAASYGIGGLALTRAIFKATFESAQNEIDTAARKQQSLLDREQAESANQAASDRAAAKATTDNANIACVAGVASAACTVGGGLNAGTSGTAATNRSILAGSTKVFDSTEKLATARGQADAQTNKATGEEASARGTLAAKREEEMKKAQDQFDKTIEQLLVFAKTQGEEEAAARRVRV
jgi:hypothetical protein